ncbi:MAG: hypothetical protein NTY04_02495 [Candidatus Staskawiczbacteria bacterium]|nr:hypothetical protein [Candidatus Staskawiczbacteria bacterium]
MTAHSGCEEFKCTKCSASYIPFKKDFKCPKCGEPIAEFYDFIPETIDAMKCHWEMFGSYTPPMWFSGPFSDYVLTDIFNVFDAIEDSNPADPEEFIKDLFAKAEYDEEYQRKHIEEMALLIYQDYKVNKNSYKKGGEECEEYINKDLLIKIAKEQFKLDMSSPHGINHWKRVRIIGKYLSEGTDADWEVICCFAYFHDVKRENEGDDPLHGHRAGEFVNEFFHLEGGDLSKKQMEQLKYACDFHCQPGAKSDDITVQTCWDADRLDLWRVGMIPDPQFLNTEKAKKKETIEWSKKLYENWGK